MIKEVLKNKNLRKALLLAILLRVLMMPFLYHPDIKTYNFQSSFLRQGVINIYPYLINHRQELPLKEEFVYFPLTYLFIGGYQAAVAPLLGPSFDHWLYDSSAQSVNDTGVYKYLFFLKIPYLILDICLAFLLMSFFESPEQRKKAFLFWLFNPFSIILIYVFGNLDIIPVFLSVWSLKLAMEKRIFWSAFLLGVAGGFKAYPLLFVPFLFLYANSWKDKILSVVAPLGVFLAVILPFYSKAFVTSALNSGLTNRIVEVGIPLGFGESVLITVLIMALLFFYLLEKRRVSFGDFKGVWVAALLVVLSFIHFHIQWLLWVMPLAVLVLVEIPDLVATFIILGIVGFLIPFLYDDKSMNVGIFSVINNFYNLFPTPFTIVQKIYDPLILQSALHSVFAAGSLFVIYKLLRRAE